jgi:hypothetical protein
MMFLKQAMKIIPNVQIKSDFAYYEYIAKTYHTIMGAGRGEKPGICPTRKK